ncbi:hypothetical protein [Chrysiogenes arsenatis]|uniref:hypothetical protein n=1 Tax=Chrysiogenes arsenatis TaxID=309797 RepID=UPI0004148A2C|nr:hypothetical protein [Chrysiogenes arsenatis]
MISSSLPTTMNHAPAAVKIRSTAQQIAGNATLLPTDGLQKVALSSPPKIAPEPPKPTQEQLEAAEPYIEFWQNGEKIAAVSKGGFLYSSTNDRDYSSIIAKDGNLRGKELADQRAQLLEQLLGSTAEKRVVGAAKEPEVHFDFSSSQRTYAIAGSADSYSRWLAKHGKEIT